MTPAPFWALHCLSLWDRGRRVLQRQVEIVDLVAAAGNLHFDRDGVRLIL